MKVFIKILYIQSKDSRNKRKTVNKVFFETWVPKEQAAEHELITETLRLRFIAEITETFWGEVPRRKISSNCQ